MASCYLQVGIGPSPFSQHWRSEEVRMRFLRCPWCRSTRLMTPHQYGKHVCRGCSHTIMSENRPLDVGVTTARATRRLGKVGRQEISRSGPPGKFTSGALRALLFEHG